ncbi:eukaryotic peptide chain release factor subunit, putative [Eimeria tenella]|uniref:Eukaryotic peptide chain release factor subunit 1 n=1 Tax=Eimeria tenella TaxID=5802 RepID=U6KSD4_EIMTE|nr:eukaryotic peptide chain release factor subunit, putative [Eimeria tenella]CDJ39843.1 eukaryotic peptide chain release factor subunit, putative [Eimeria tenella]|eukprot:XP_013230596.1 eukaryotic peptide chain release factor subunit, putative [Eimeria tenella]
MSDMFDQRLQSKIIKIVDISYGGDNGFNQAIELAAETLQNVKFIQEKRLIGRFFEEVAQDTGKYVFGVLETLQALEMGAVDILIVYEALDVLRITLKQSCGETKVVFASAAAAKKDFLNKEGEEAEVEIINQETLTEWLVNNYKNFGAQLEFVTNKSQEGSQFEKGFGGLGGILRYKVDFCEEEEAAHHEADEEFI